MKYCPKCIRTYDDDTFSFCLEDGSLLLKTPDSEENFNLSQATRLGVNRDSAPTEYLPLSQSSAPTEYLSINTEFNRYVPGVTVASDLSLIIAEMEYEIREHSQYLPEAEISVQIAVEILMEGLKLIAQGKDPKELKTYLLRAGERVRNMIDLSRRPLNNINEISRLVLNACRDRHITELIMQAVNVLGKEAFITTGPRHTESSVRIIRGVQFDRGFFSSEKPYQEKNGEVSLYNPGILLTTAKLTNADEIAPVFDKLRRTTNRELLIITPDVPNDTLNNILMKAGTAGLKVVVVKAPGFGERQRNMLFDMAVLTNAKVLDGEEKRLAAADLSDLGQVLKAVINKDSTVFAGVKGSEVKIAARVEQIKKELKETTSDYDREKLQQRLDTLFGKVAMIGIGGFSDDERREKLRLCNRAIHFLGLAAGSSSGTGFLPEAKLALVNIAAVIAGQTYPFNEMEIFLILAKAFEAPYKIMLQNNGKNSDEILKSLRTIQRSQNNDSIGYDPGQNKFINTVDEGLIVPTASVKYLIDLAVGSAALKLEGFRKSDGVIKKLNN